MGFLTGILSSIGEQSRALLQRQGFHFSDRQNLVQLCHMLISVRGEASGVALARHILDQWKQLVAPERLAFLLALAEQFGPDVKRLEQAVRIWQTDRTASAVMELHLAAEPKRQEVIRRLNLAPHGIETLIRMREELFEYQKDHPALGVLDADFQHLFGSWFNRGFLELKRVDWSTPANILEKIIRYEAVHQIRSWDELRLRLQPPDRRCFAFFHPQLPDDPLIFVEVALTSGTPGRIASLLAPARQTIEAKDATTAVFYSISNCQEGLRGISFGNFLIKQVVEDLKRELPKLNQFVTLSPVPGLARWLASVMAKNADTEIPDEEKSAFAHLAQSGWMESPEAASELSKFLLPAAAFYLLKAKNDQGRPLDPVSRFHLGNGARLENVHFGGDLSDKGLHQSHGVMVNYLYKLDEIEHNHEAYASKGEVAASGSVRKLLRPDASYNGAGKRNSTKSMQD